MCVWSRQQSWEFQYHMFQSFQGEGQIRKNQQLEKSNLYPSAKAWNYVRLNGTDKSVPSPISNARGTKHCMPQLTPGCQVGHERRNYWVKVSHPPTPQFDKHPGALFPSFC